MKFVYMRKRAWILIGLMSVMLVFAGCSKKGDTQDNAAQGSEGGSQSNAGMESGSGTQTGTTKLIKLGEYKGVEVPAMDLEVTEEELQNEIDKVLLDYAYFQDIEGKTVVEEGDYVNIDFRGLLDGEAFQGGTSAEGGYDLEIGSGAFIPGFEDQLIGKELGGFYELDLQFPETYGNAELAGKPVIFEVTINKIEEHIIPELTEEFAKEGMGYKSVEDCKNSLREELEAMKLEDAKMQKEYDVLEAVINNSEFETAQDEIEAQAQEMIATYEYYASASGVDLATFLLFAMGGMSVEDFQEQCRRTSEFSIKSALVISAVEEAEGFTLSDEEYTQKAEAMLDEYGYKSLEEFETAYTREAIQENIMRNQVVDFLMEQAVETA